MRKRYRLLFQTILLLCSLCSLQSGWGQIVNIEDKLKRFDSVGWYGRIDIGGNITQNNQTIRALTGSTRVDRIGEKARNLFMVNYNFIRADEDRFINDGFAHLRHGQQLSDRWFWEAFGQLQYNRKLSIQLRGLAGTGPRFRITDEDQKWDFVVGLAYMYEYNELNEGATLRRDHRLSSYLSWQVQLNALISFASTSYYQPLLSNFSESRLSSSNTMVMNINKSLSFTSSFNITYDNLLARLTEGVPQTSYQWRNGLRVTF
jgi:hypothetical protein